MANGFSIKLHNGTTPLANQTGLSVEWLDDEHFLENNVITGSTEVATTNATGDLICDISYISDKLVGEKGYIIVRKPNVSTPEDSLVFQGQVTISDIGTGEVLLIPPNTWVKPTWWVDINNTHTVGESRLEALVAVIQNGWNPCGFKITCVGGVSVDWGDGSAIENVASNTQVFHYYDFNALPPETTSPTGIIRQAILKVTPTVGGNAFTAVDLVEVPPTANVNYQSPIVDLYLNAPSATTVNVGMDSSVLGRLGRLQRINMPQLGVVSFSYGFQNCYSLRKITALDLSNCTGATALFNSCYSLQSIPYLNTSKITVANEMFRYCYSLTQIPRMDLSKVQQMNTFCENNYSLKTICLLNLAEVSAGNNMFNGCSSLVSVPNFNFAKLTNMQAMFGSCASLKVVPVFNMPLVTGFNEVFTGCRSLDAVPLLNTSGITSMSTTFNGCHSLAMVPALNLSSCTNLSSIFAQCSSIQRSLVTGVKESHTYVAALLNAAALNEIYTNLATVTAKTITVTGNPGIAGGHNPSIATAKGWTVTA